MDTIAPLTEVRARLPQLVRQLQRRTRGRILVTRNGRPAAFLVSPEEMETLEILSDKRLMLSLLRGEEDARRGRLVRHDELFR